MKHKHKWEYVDNFLYWCSVCGTLRETKFVDPKFDGKNTTTYKELYVYKKPECIKQKAGL